MKRALVWEVLHIKPHPNADRLELVYLCDGRPPQNPDGSIHVNALLEPLVTGKHYKAGQLGVYVPSGMLMPGLLADQMWAAGKARCLALYPVEAKNLRGIMSDGFFMGQYFADDGEARERGEMKRWALWPENFNVRPGDDLTDFFGLRELNSHGRTDCGCINCTDTR